ncbi:MAG: endonuclease/exonuclease/phosphatase family protein [Planctomycetota bacterium]|nr:endonuclease/exonuclease/phosphatase family protein [Planctomycetota bacterium]MDA1158973.1 endonuclease/exonuclease/phosphatase family protein [Planctomycetota bacterium]
MIYRILNTAILITVLNLVLMPGQTAAEELGIAFWNVENLFDTVDDPKTEGDEEFTPGEPKAWTETRLELKLTNLARVISDMNSGRGPDVLGLCEIENRTVLEMLVASLKKTGRDYRIVHEDSPSYRGIDCALLYDAKTVTLDQSRIHRVEKFPTRDILEARFTSGGKPFFVFVNHWPSRRNPDANRIEVASVLRRRIDQLLKSDPAVDFAVIGDLNDTPSDPSVSKTLRTWGNAAELRPGVLFNSMWKFHQEGDAGTYVYQNKWDVLDHIILSPGMLDGQGVNWVADSTRRVKADYQMFVSKTPGTIPKPSRSYLGPRFFGNGYSDHLPVECRLSVAAD